jgi:hypothetical protein
VSQQLNVAWPGFIVHPSCLLLLVTVSPSDAVSVLSPSLDAKNAWDLPNAVVSWCLSLCHQVPLAMDSLGYHIVVVLPPLDIRLLRVELLPTAGPKQSAVAQLTVVRELSIMSVGSQLTVRIMPNCPRATGATAAAYRHGKAGAGSKLVILQSSMQVC